MTLNDDILSLTGGDSYITENASDAYKVISGSALVYVVPVIGNESGRRSLVFEAAEGTTVPSLFYTDSSYHTWKFCISCIDGVQLRIIRHGTTSALKTRFAKAAGIKHLNSEGFENSFADLYTKNIVKEDALLRKNIYRKGETERQNLKLIYDSLKSRHAAPFFGGSDDTLYSAAAFACKRYGMHIVDYDKLTESCGKDFSFGDIARISHFSYREIKLEPGWYKKDCGIIIAFDEKNEPAACVPKDESSYEIFYPKTNKVETLTKSSAEHFQQTALTFYRPFPAKALDKKDLLSFCKKSIMSADIIMLILMTIAGALTGILLPALNKQLFDNYIPLKDISLPVQLCLMAESFVMANIFFVTVKNLITLRISSRITYDCQNAVYDRLFNLPKSFFRRFDSADLAQRAMTAGSVIGKFGDDILLAFISSINSAVYLICGFRFSVKLSVCGLVFMAVYSVLIWIIAYFNTKNEKESIALNGTSSSKIYQIISGIDKIRIAGVEDRALTQYLEPFCEMRRHEQRREKLKMYANIVGVAAEYVFMIIIYSVVSANRTVISLGDFLGFTSAFAGFSVYAAELVGIAADIFRTRSVYKWISPILKECPEPDVSKEMPGEINGAIEINNLSFAYSDNPAVILDNISLNIKPGEYIGIAGSSGSGKSTLLKLLLGFEQPSSGKIYYDGKDIESLDKRELRKKFGVVLQNGNLISGSIFENIGIASPSAEEKDIIETAKAIGLDEDIRKMPMGYNTILSENCGSVSGGQQQRILIARALISNPSILFFDEATSALDNITQEMVCKALDNLNITRIVIAHRLSTIMKCDRIIVLDSGKIAEQGTYDELMKKRGELYRLAKRQL